MLILQNNNQNKVFSRLASPCHCEEGHRPDAAIYPTNKLNCQSDSFHQKYNLQTDTVSFFGRKRIEKKKTQESSPVKHPKDSVGVELNKIGKQLNRIGKDLAEIKTETVRGVETVSHSQHKHLEPLKRQLETLKTRLEVLEQKNKKDERIKHKKARLDRLEQALESKIKIRPLKLAKDRLNMFAEVDLTYKNSLNLKSTPNFSYGRFKEELENKVPGIIDEEKAAERVSSLSRYLKEKMIGFEVPEYELNGEKKGGYEWLERGLENLLIGSKKQNLKPEENKDTAKELFGILSVHDNYWKSPEFAGYLSSLKTSLTININQTKAVDSTIQAIKELNEPVKIGFGAKETILMVGENFTPMKVMPEIVSRCAYTGKKLYYDNEDEVLCTSAEHIVPQSWQNSKNDDGNFIASAASNNKRGNMPLIDYLKGTDGYYKPNRLETA